MSQSIEDTKKITEKSDLPPGHPVSVFRKENEALRAELNLLQTLLNGLDKDRGGKTLGQALKEIHNHFQRLQEVDKHYKRKEDLLFPFLESHRVTAPATAMWGKHDEIRKLLKSAVDSLQWWETLTANEAVSVRNLVLNPAVTAIADMIVKEEEALYPASINHLTSREWQHIHKQSPEIGYCLIEKPEDWQPPAEETKPVEVKAPPPAAEEEKIMLPSGSFTLTELTAILNTLPVDVTFVDRDGKIRYFSEGKKRIFTHNRTAIGRQVHHCHPPKVLPMVEKILADFRAGKQDSEAFWYSHEGKFVHNEYFPLRSEAGEYLGILEVSQDLTEKKKLKGERRLLTHGSAKK